ncbi:flippase [Aquimarina brevivitae]|uniref:PST family polysaccharide transporter n=1 Tax=Aquimarina brevivitae TaxID=323412 RepID=A0A4Q7PFN1_9FLAO|nr:flippase [Aquimarina brevivitae]RZS99286.1 PST family polysaccharide transporter [Aquimarina brevivitae]
MNLKNLRKLLARNKVIVSNFSYLSVLQICNLLIPLLAYPYLIRRLGSEVFGKVIFAQAIVSYLVIVVNFGFNISGVRSVSLFREHKHKLSEIFSSIFWVKVSLCLFLSALLVVATFFIPAAKEYQWLLILTLWMCIYEVLFPIWYFQGIERMHYITIVTLSAKFIFLVAIFILIKQPDDYLKVPIIQGVTTLITGAVALYIINKRHQVHILVPSLRTMRKEIKAALPIFISNISIQLYLATNKVIVGLFLGMKEVAIYDLAEKIVSVLKIPQSLITQTIFPKINREKNILFIKKMYKISLGVNVLIFCSAFIIAEFMVVILGGNELTKGTEILRILLFTIPVTAMSNVFGVQLLIPFGFNKTFSKGIVASGIFYFILIMAIWFFLKFTITNITYATVATEIFVTLLLYYLCRKHNLWQKR